MNSKESKIAQFRPRAGQREFERGVEAHRICACLARRQYGKTTNCARISLKKMMKVPGHTVVFGSVKVDLGREIVRKEAAELHTAIASLSGSLPAKALLDVVDDKGASVSAVSADDFADLYENSRLEMRLYHSKSVYSRTKVLALTPDAVGETGDIILDEVGRAKNFQGVWEAMKPIIASNPNYRAILTTTPPPDDAHFSWALLSPPAGYDPAPKAEGNWYKSDLGVWCLRITAYDAYADNVPLYDDDTGEPLSPEESRRRDHDKDAWDRNYGVKFTVGGTSACGILQLNTAQTRGIGQCALFQVQEDSDMQQALTWLRTKLTDGKVGIGWDLATTTKGLSNPTSVSILEQVGNEFILRACFVWKTAEPEIAMERVRMIVQTVRIRPAGPARKLCIDGQNERYFAKLAQKDLRSEAPVEIVIGSETVEVLGQSEKITVKQQTCGRLVEELDDNHLWLPPEQYLKEDWRLVKKEKGQFVCEPDGQGRHGDTFDATRFALRAIATGGPVAYSAINIRSRMGDMGLGKVSEEVCL